MKKAIMSFSGGMDSTSLLLRLLREGCQVHTIAFNYGQKHIIELERAKMNIQYLKENGYEVNHRIVDISSAMSIFSGSLTSQDESVPEGHYEEEQMKSTVVPNRNAIFASIVYGYALSVSKDNDCDVSISLGVHSGDHAIYPDCRPEFYTALSEAFTIGNWDSERISFNLPYIDGDKVTILEDALISCEELGLDFDIIFANTNTSYAPDKMGRSSGKTGSDIERILAFKEIGRRDPVSYQGEWEDILSHAVKIENEYKDNQYLKTLTKLQYQVTRKGATERPFTGEYNDEKRIGIFECICCGHQLFDSTSKYDSGCGWPAFYKENDAADIQRIPDNSHGMIRIEVKCSKCNAHLGHVFDDGPKEFGGERYCINSASMNFKEG